jgi:hypothetical protein
MQTKLVLFPTSDILFPLGDEVEEVLLGDGSLWRWPQGEWPSPLWQSRLVTTSSAMHCQWVCIAPLSDLARQALILCLAPLVHHHLPTIDAPTQATNWDDEINSSTMGMGNYLV